MRTRPLHVAAVAVLAAFLFVLARWAVAADGEIERFVLAGDRLTTADVPIVTVPGAGYDGQFSYRLAVDPTDLGATAHGVRLDGPLRLQRITYPALVHVLSLGQREWVPWVMVLVNVAAVGLLALLGARVARDAGRSPWAGMLVPGFSGFVMTLSRNLTELVTVVLLVLAVRAWQQDRGGLAAAALSLAVLSRETVLVLAGAWVLHALVRHRRRRDALLGLLPLLVFVGWQSVCWLGYGQVPVLDSGGRNLVLPFTDLGPALVDWLRGAAALDRQGLVDAGQAAVLALTVGLAAARGTTTGGGRAGVRAAWGAAALLVVCLSESVWRGPADFRTAAELHVLSAVLLLQSARRLVLPGTLAAAAVLVTALLRITSL